MAEEEQQMKVTVEDSNSVESVEEVVESAEDIPNTKEDELVEDEQNAAEELMEELDLSLSEEETELSDLVGKWVKRIYPVSTVLETDVSYTQTESGDVQVIAPRLNSLPRNHRSVIKRASGHFPWMCNAPVYVFDVSSHGHLVYLQYRKYYDDDDDDDGEVVTNVLFGDEWEDNGWEECEEEAVEKDKVLERVVELEKLRGESDWQSVSKPSELHNNFVIRSGPYVVRNRRTKRANSNSNLNRRKTPLRRKHRKGSGSMDVVKMVPKFNENGVQCGYRSVRQYERSTSLNYRLTTSVKYLLDANHSMITLANIDPNRKGTDGISSYSSKLTDNNWVRAPEYLVTDRMHDIDQLVEHRNWWRGYNSDANQYLAAQA